jgi:folylpolyglutamate synthase/dihydropteroate synthase
LVHARERIRINGQPISEQYFAEHFFRVYDTLTASLSEVFVAKYPILLKIIQNLL